MANYATNGRPAGGACAGCQISIRQRNRRGLVERIPSVGGEASGSDDLRTDRSCSTETSRRLTGRRLDRRARCCGDTNASCCLSSGGCDLCADRVSCTDTGCVSGPRRNPTSVFARWEKCAPLAMGRSSIEGRHGLWLFDKDGTKEAVVISGSRKLPDHQRLTGTAHRTERRIRKPKFVGRVAYIPSELHVDESRA